MSKALLLSFALAFSSLAQAPASAPSRQKQADAWWKHAVIYEIYPRSFPTRTVTASAILTASPRGLTTSRSLGIDAIWLTPIYPSPQVDFGYDISDYENSIRNTARWRISIGSLRRRRSATSGSSWIWCSTTPPTNILGLCNLRTVRSNPKRDWYIWRDGKGPGQPPNNWQSRVRALRVAVRSEDEPVLLSQVLHRAARPQLAQSRS